MKRQLSQELLLHHDLAEGECVARRTAAAGGGCVARQAGFLLVFSASRNLYMRRNGRRAKRYTGQNER